MAPEFIPGQMINTPLIAPEFIPGMLNCYSFPLPTFAGFMGIPG